MNSLNKISQCFKNGACALKLIILLISLSSSPAQALSLSEAMSGSDEGYKKAIEIQEFKFPKDHGDHKGFKTEWWYFTGNLDSKEGKHFGYQLTLFRNQVKPDSEFNKNKKSKWNSNQIYMGHFGLSEVSTQKFYSFEIFEREALGLAGFQTKPFKVSLDDWQIVSKSQNNKTIFPLQLKACREDVCIDLELESSDKEPTLQGDKGLSQKSSEKGNASYYYSMTNLKTKGIVSIKNKDYKVTGKSWMDREWSTSALAKDQEGWDWFALQFEDNTELMIYQMRNKDGTIDEYSSAVFIDTKGKKEKLDFSKVQMKVLQTWQSASSKGIYPVEWQIISKDKKLQLDIKVQAYFPNQEHQFDIGYWEGCVKISGTKSMARTQGKGYLEMTGYTKNEQ